MLRFGAYLIGTYGIHVEMGISLNGAGLGVLAYMRWPCLEILAAFLILGLKVTIGEIDEIMKKKNPYSKGDDNDRDMDYPKGSRNQRYAG